jgi:ArsR family metal-binding transcriptional regulator
LPELLLHLAADLLLHCEIRCVEPCFAERFHFRIGGAVEPRIGAAGAVAL